MIEDLEALLKKANAAIDENLKKPTSFPSVSRQEGAWNVDYIRNGAARRIVWPEAIPFDTKASYADHVRAILQDPVWKGHVIPSAKDLFDTMVALRSLSTTSDPSVSLARTSLEGFLANRLRQYRTAKDAYGGRSPIPLLTSTVVQSKDIGGYSRECKEYCRVDYERFPIECKSEKQTMWGSDWKNEELHKKLFATTNNVLTESFRWVLGVHGTVDLALAGRIVVSRDHEIAHPEIKSDYAQVEGRVLLVKVSSP